tara:strand:+ start:954 stop:1823 length:870 start_codon:yes stop_codon:yes gene_type:complete
VESAKGRDIPTETVDYVKFQRKTINFKGGGSNYYGLNMPDNKVTFDFNDNCVYIALQNQLNTAYMPAYRQTDLGVAGMALAEGITGGNKMENLVQTVQDAANAALPEFTAGTFAQAAQGASQMLGLAGSISANDILQLSKGKIFNPYTEQMFSNMQFRSHQFNFKMFARDAREAQEIGRIIAYIKEGSLPSYSGDKGRYFEVPEKFDISFKRMDPHGKFKSDVADLHFKIHTSVCAGIQVNYTPDGQYTSFKQLVKEGNFAGVHVPAVQVGLTFLETKFVTAEDVEKGF